MQTENPANIEGQSLVSHLVELHGRLLKSLCAVLVVFLIALPFAGDIYALVATPLIKNLPSGSTMIATQVASPFLVPFKLTLFGAIFVTMPYILAQLWSFVAPGLYQNEQRLIRPLIISSILLFYAGTAFAYYIVFPLIFNFFNAIVPENVTVMTDMSHYLDFIIKLFFAFGLAFEVPVATMLLIWSGFTSAATLAKNRSYVIIAAFVLGMLLTPPDVISQILMALPVWLLFEAGLFLSRKIPVKDYNPPS